MDIYEVKQSNDDTWYLKNNFIHRDGDLPARESKNGTKVWYKNGFVHRDGDLPVAIDPSCHSWYKEGDCHRDNDLPAIVSTDGIKKSWYQHGKKHRVGAPAVIEKKHSFYRAIEEWWFEGEKHREDGPAVTHDNTYLQEWWIKGKKHREDGPAVICEDGTKEYWLDGRQIPEQDFQHELEKRNLHNKLQVELVPLKRKERKRKI